MSEQTKDQRLETKDSPTWPHVVAFAQRMERKLELNRHKGDREAWLKQPVEFLVCAMGKEIQEFEQAYKDGNAEAIAMECADIANFAAMIADWYLVHADWEGKLGY